MAAKLKTQILTAFKMHGFTLRSEASKYLVDILSPINEDEQEEWIDKIIEIIQKQPLSSSVIDKTLCETAVLECNAEQEDDCDKMFSVIDAFSIPRYSYGSDRKKFILNSELGLSLPALFGTPADKANLFRDRYTVLHQRTLRHDLFTTPVLKGVPEENNKKFHLKPIEYLIGSTSKLGEIIVLGMLTQLKEGKWFLEDPSGTVQIDLTTASFHTGLFTENSFVLAEGWYEDGIFHVNAFGFPPPEPAKVSRAYFGNINFFGGPSSVNVKSSMRLKQMEEENEDAMFVFLSDVWLDQMKVLEKLKELFRGYSEFPPTCFVLCGNFTSAPHGNHHVHVLKESFHNLAEIINDFPTLKDNSQFVFVPGPQDPGPSTILPRPAIPDSVAMEIKKKVPTAIFASNPCRIQYCTQEIIVFREDIVTKMCRNCVKFPSDGDVPKHFAKTIISQAHLCPLPLHVCPVYWSYDDALRVYPLPDVIVCADKFDPFHTTTVDCTVMNPGSFSRTGFNFKVYFPANREIQDSKIQDES